MTPQYMAPIQFHPLLFNSKVVMKNLNFHNKICHWIDNQLSLEVLFIDKLDIFHSSVLLEL